MPIVLKSPKAKDDLADHYAYLYLEAGEGIAERFSKSVDSSFEILLAEPMIGSPLETQHPALSGMRKWRVKGFERALIFYTPAPQGILIVRVLHASQDWWELLGIT